MHDQPEHAGQEAYSMDPVVRQWRKAERERLIAERLTIPADQRADMAAHLAIELDKIVGNVEGRVISVYWPFRGEPDLRPWLASLVARGAVGALPIVIEKARPLIFRAYKPGDPLEKGVWNIPVPATDTQVVPDVTIAPVVGFDAACFRLGYGGGFFDRTLAALARKPLVIGVGYEMQRIGSVQPQPHDIPMDVIVTEQTVAAR